MEQDSQLIRATIFETIEKQIRDDQPREVKQTLARLLSEGHTKDDAMKLIGCVLANEIFEIKKHQTSFNESRYIENLKKLPAKPWEKGEANGV